MTETQIQIGVMYWAGQRSLTCPALKLLHHIPNEGKRSPQQGAMMKQAGLKSGVPDLFLPVAKNGFHGLYIELKNGHKKPTANQTWWLEKLSEQGYACYVCESLGAAVAVVSDYLTIDPGIGITEADQKGIIPIKWRRNDEH